jgi:hypothetical protein
MLFTKAFDISGIIRKFLIRGLYLHKPSISLQMDVMCKNSLTKHKFFKRMIKNAYIPIISQTTFELFLKIYPIPTLGILCPQSMVLELLSMLFSEKFSP